MVRGGEETPGVQVAVPQTGIQRAEPLGGGEEAKPSEADSF